MDLWFVAPHARKDLVGLSLAVVLGLSACQDVGQDPTPAVQVIDVQLQNAATYEYPTVGGDEEGALISRQAQHYSVSEIRRNASTNWVCIYVYQAQTGYVGSDFVELEIHTNKVRTSEHAGVSKLRLQFTIAK